MAQSTGSTVSSVSTSHASSAKPETPLPDMPNEEQSNYKRLVGRWYIGETLGKGGYSWVKKGYDQKTGRPVALKFMDRRRTASGWSQKQFAQVKNETEALKKLRHPHVVRLLAYNYKTHYPSANPEEPPREVILLVLEYMPGGELFDILYYTSKLNEVLARTYFQQLISGIEACHSQSIVHRDIKPQNLLLDKYFSLKITDFGLAKIVRSDRDAVMDTFSVGTRGYQPPEVLKKQPYTASCDIFSAGVVLFILLAGYPPFEHANEQDKWYGNITRGDYKSFWRMHKPAQLRKAAQDLLTRMILYDPRERITMAGIRDHPWFHGETLRREELANVLYLKHKQMESKRRRDPMKQKLLHGSERKPGDKRPIKFPKVEPQVSPLELELSAQDVVYSGNPSAWLRLVKELHAILHANDAVSYTLSAEDGFECKITLDAQTQANLRIVIYERDYDGSIKPQSIFFARFYPTPNQKEALQPFVDEVREKLTGALGASRADEDEKSGVQDLPDTENVGLLDSYTTAEWHEVLSTICYVVQRDCKGTAALNFQEQSVELQAAVQAVTVDHAVNSVVRMMVRVYRYPKYECNVVKFLRLEGTYQHFNMLVQYLQTHCDVFTGIPAKFEQTLQLGTEEEALVNKYFA